MKKIFPILVTLMFVSLMLMVVTPTNASTVANCTADGDEEWTVNLSAGTLASPDSFSYNSSTIDVPKNACVKLVLKNLSVANPHDAYVGGDIKASTDIIDENEVAYVLFMTPNVSADTAIDFFCTVEGHRDQGMEGTLNVLNKTVDEMPSGGSAPGFELPLLVLASLSLIGLRKLK